MKNFSELSLSPWVRRGVDAAGFENPRPIQAEAIPVALEGRDVLGLAQTGTGKTAAFALPILERLSTTRGRGVRALVIAPTRELAAQISDEFETLARFTRLKVATLFGGVTQGKQKAALRANPEIVVACPGRLLDLVQQRLIRLDTVETLVLDEADHMFDMDFLPDIRKILDLLPKRRQNLMFSATMPRDIRRLASQVLQRPEVVSIHASKPMHTIDHRLCAAENGDKTKLLKEVLADPNFVSGIVFTRTKHRAKRLAIQLDKAGYEAVALQGNMSQNQRVQAMSGFREGRFKVLVATDIAARGIDVEQVSHVVNYDFPTTPDAYTHRIGRTGRSERYGRAVTFVTDADKPMVTAVERQLGKAIPRIRFTGSNFESAPTAAAPRPTATRRRRRRRRGAPQRRD